jgi:hypothetical protein
LTEQAHDGVAQAVWASVKTMTRGQRIALWLEEEGGEDSLEMWLYDGEKAADTFDPLVTYPDALEPFVRRVTRGLVARMAS